MLNNLKNEYVTNDFRKNQTLGLSILLTLGSIDLIVVLSNHYLFRTYAFDYSVYNFAFFDYPMGVLALVVSIFFLTTLLFCKTTFF
jgi:hypothetical protein